MTARRVEYAQPPDVTWTRLEAAFAQVGKVEESNPQARYLVGKARYGMNPVRLRVSVMTGPTKETSVLEVQGRGQDLWGTASRKVIDRLIAAL